MVYLNGVADAVKSAPNPASPASGISPGNNCRLRRPALARCRPARRPERKPPWAAKRSQRCATFRGTRLSFSTTSTPSSARSRTRPSRSRTRIPGRRLGEPGVPGAAQLDASPEMDSGNPRGDVNPLSTNVRRRWSAPCHAPSRKTLREGGPRNWQGGNRTVSVAKPEASAARKRVARSTRAWRSCFAQGRYGSRKRGGRRKSQRGRKR